jgi:hypothetical protein
LQICNGFFELSFAFPQTYFNARLCFKSDEIRYVEFTAYAPFPPSTEGVNILENLIRGNIKWMSLMLVNRLLTGRSDWFKKRSRILLRLMLKRNLKFDCISSKENLAHDIARGAHEEKETIEISIPLYELSHKAFIAYQRETKNKNCSKLIAQRKLTRNIMLSIKAKEESGIILYRYGNLNIYVEDNTIVRLGKGTFSKGFKKSKNEYKRLNKLLYL